MRMRLRWESAALTSLLRCRCIATPPQPPMHEERLLPLRQQDAGATEHQVASRWVADHQETVSHLAVATTNVLIQSLQPPDAKFLQFIHFFLVPLLVRERNVGNVNAPKCSQTAAVQVGRETEVLPAQIKVACGVKKFCVSEDVVHRTWVGHQQLLKTKHSSRQKASCDVKLCEFVPHLSIDTKGFEVLVQLFDGLRGLPTLLMHRN
mmetsp:Transcript_97769/g.276559  ORF Transcript_97769/g.276559 Transcript_97769/m.276559 type:complete len:207 (+) Transcript_97769:129-749(+)